MWGTQEWGRLRGWGRPDEYLADDPVLLTVALPQGHHLSPQDLVLPGERVEDAEASEFATQNGKVQTL